MQNFENEISAIRSLQEPFRATLLHRHQSAAPLAELKRARLEALARAAIAGDAPPATKSIDQQIAALQAEGIRDGDAADIAATAIDILDQRIADLAAEKAAIDAQTAKAAVESLGPELEGLSHKITEAWGRIFAEIKGLQPGAIWHAETHCAALLQLLKKAGAVAWIQRQHFHEDSPWNDFHKLLASIRTNLISQLTRIGETVPDWAWEGTPFDVDSSTAPIIDRLRNAGVNIAHHQPPNVAQVGFAQH